MATARQDELLNSFLSQLGDESAPLYRELIMYMAELGYQPKKEKSSISFKHHLHNKQMAKMSFKGNKEPYPVFALRFSACRGLSQRFADIVGATIEKYPARAARCTSGGCGFCRGEARTHVYTHTFPGGETKFHCGAYALEIPQITAADMEEIKKLIKEQHQYLLEHEAGIA